MSVYYDLGRVVGPQGPRGPQGPAGSPLTAATAAAMTDTAACYLYTGSESGMLAGHVYGHDGSGFVDLGPFGGVTQTEVDSLLFSAADSSLWSEGTIKTDTGANVSVSSHNRLRTAYLPAGIRAVEPRAGYEAAVYVYDGDGHYLGVWDGSDLLQQAFFHSGRVRFAFIDPGYRIRLVCRAADGAALTAADAEQILLGWAADPSLTREGEAADAAATGAALFRAKSRELHLPAALTYWKAHEAFDGEHPAGPMDMPVNSYTYALGVNISGFGNDLFSVGGNTAWWVYCLANLYSTAVRTYILHRRGSSGNLYIGTTIDSGATVTWQAVKTAVDDGLSASGAAADAAATGAALFQTKDREENFPAAFTWWESSDCYSAENPAAPADMPVNSYTYALGSLLAGFNNDVFTLPAANAYMVWCWANLHNAATRYYIVLGTAGSGKLYFGRTMNSGAAVTWKDLTPPAVDSEPTDGSANLVTSGGVYAALPQIDDSLSVSGAAADAAATGAALYRAKSRSLHLPAALTYWKVHEAFDAENPAGPTDMPANSYTYTLGANISGFSNDLFSVGGGTGWWLYCAASLYNTAIRTYVLHRRNADTLYVGTTTDGGATVIWSDRCRRARPDDSILFFGDSITRGREGGERDFSPWRIPETVGAQLGINCQNFGIGSLGWLAQNNGLNALGYLQKVGDPDYHDSNDGVFGHKFIGSGSWADFTAIVIALGTNDVSHPLGSLSELDDSLSDEQVLALTPTTIAGAMYQCYRYIRSVAPDLHIILADPLLTRSGSAPCWSYDVVRAGGYTRRQLNDLYAAFCQRYGLGHISTWDAPVNHVDPHVSLPDGVHPSAACYRQLGRYFAKKLAGVTEAALPAARPSALSGLVYKCDDVSLWSAGVLKLADGTTTSVAAHNRTYTAFLPHGIRRVTPDSGYQINVYGYDAAGTYLGVWNGSGWDNSSHFTTDTVDLTALGPGLKLRLTCAATDNSVLSLSDMSHIVFGWAPGEAVLQRPGAAPLLTAAGSGRLTLTEGGTAGIALALLTAGGSLTVTADTGVTLNGSAAGSKSLPAPYTGGELTCVAPDVWLLRGDIV